ncbi:zinc-dependent alcohol dehydrogenase [Metabacillus schmidteae]|uniref:zinc-dependent alcohol dehydrogenase n=1 Tax=Metabacillus schmidteae TaxID=2730405 RepID=UPI001588B505|nr:alcohol dehydrogenase catalytic domain-containing protein [Metabacillus schmidteae]
MKAALFDRVEHFTVIGKEVPKIKGNEVLIQVISAGICGSDIHAYLGKHPFRHPPSILGHEVVGEIIELGHSVSTYEEGDMVTIEPQIGCGNCHSCIKGDYNLCEEKVVLGTTKWDGGFAEYVVAKEKSVYKLPKSLTPDLAVLTEPLAVGVHAVNIAEVKKGDKVAILGSGPIGLVTAVAAHAKGAETICLTDAIDKNLEIGKKLCATDVVNVRYQSLKEYAAAHIGQFDHVFLTASYETIVDDALNIIKRKGKIISIALFEEQVSIDLNRLMISEIQIYGSSMYVKEDFNMAIDILASRKYKLESLITHRYQFDQINEAMEVALTKNGSPIKIVLDMMKN